MDSHIGFINEDGQVFLNRNVLDTIISCKFGTQSELQVLCYLIVNAKKGHFHYNFSTIQLMMEKLNISSRSVSRSISNLSINGYIYKYNDDHLLLAPVVWPYENPNEFVADPDAYFREHIKEPDPLNAKF